MATLLPNAVQQFVDANGVPIAGGSVFFYVPNSTVPKDTWSDPAGTILNTNPIVLNAAGENPAGGIYGSGAYRQVVYDADGNLLWDQLTADTAVGGLAWGGTSTGTANAQVISASSFSSQDGQQISFVVGSGLTNTSALTVTPGTGNAIPVLRDSESGPVPLTGGEVAGGNAITLIYDGARGAFHLVQNDFTVANYSLLSSVPLNLALQVTANSPTSNALTIAIKTLAGADPSTQTPVYIPFRNVSAPNGTPAQLAITAATSLTISSGSTLGTTSAVAAHVWVTVFNDSGTAKLGAVNCLSGSDIFALRDGIFSATAEGGVGGADSAQVIYAATTVTSKPMTVIGYVDISEATAGSWSSSPTTVQLLTAATPLPRSIVQTKRSESGTAVTGTTVMPFDNTIPQVTEGNEYLSRTIVPTSAGNLLHFRCMANASPSANTAISAAVFRDASANALVATGSSFGPNVLIPIGLDIYSVANTVATVTGSFRAGAATGASGVTFNGSAGVGLFGGTFISFLQIDEIMT